MKALSYIVAMVFAVFLVAPRQVVEGSDKEKEEAIASVEKHETALTELL